MTQSKHSVKIYTEEQVKEIGEWASLWDLYELDKEVNTKPPMFKEFINSLKPIELPSDEEIEEKSFGHSDIYSNQASFSYGAKWMRDKIQGGNK